jgi:tuftelin-interacting protein 11
MKSSDDKKELEDKEDGDKKRWSKKSHKNRYFYKSVKDVIEKGKKTDYMMYDSTKKMSKVTVIDMTGPEKRVLSGYHALGQAKVEESEIYETKAAKELKNFQLPELMHNLNLIVEMCEQEIIGIDKKQRLAEEKQRNLNDEKEHLEKIVTLERDYIDTLEGAFDLVERLVNPEDSLTLEESEKIFLKLKIDFKNEFEEFNLGDLVPGIIAPKIAELMGDWRPLEDPTKHVEVFKKWAGILGYQKSFTTTAFDPYPALVWSTVVPCFRRATNDWNPRVHQQMAALLDAWSELLPDWMLDNILEQIVLAKLTQEVNLWDPLTDTIPIHIWILPWSQILGSKMENNVYKIICDKLSRALRAWHPEDRSARAMITPWKNVWAEEDLQMFLHKNIVPKLELRLTEFIVNPLQQDLEIFNQVWEWNELLAPQIMAQIMDKYFFPQWIQTLVLWLNQSPNFDEVSRWYIGWKGLFNEAVLKQANVKEHFRKALELMQRATGVILNEAPIPAAPAQSQKPPSLMDLNIAPPASLEFKEMVSQKCAERGIIFVPVPGKREKGKQVYRTGKLFCYIDRSVCIISSDGGNNWTPISLNAMLDKAVTG